MHSNFRLASVTIFLTSTLITTAHAVESKSLQHQTLDELQQQFHLVLPGQKPTSASPPNTLQFIKQRQDEQQMTHIRLQQYYEGFLVHGGYAIIHSTSDANSLLITQQKQVAMNGLVYNGLQQDLGKPAAHFIRHASLALEEFKSHFNGENLSEEQAVPIVFIDDNNKGHWAYRVSVYLQSDDKIPERPTAIVDAKTYKPFIQWNNLKTSYHFVNGMGYGGNAKIGQFLYGKDFPLLELTRDDQTELCYMENLAVKVVDMHQRKTPSYKAMSFDCKKATNADAPTFWTGYRKDGFDQINGAFSPTNEAMYAGHVIKHLFQDWYKVEVLTTKKGIPMQLVMRVHYGKGFENAYWDGKQMTFGDGGSWMYPLVSLGIAAHEISHGFTEQHSNLEYYGQSGGINESFSDMSSQAAEYYSTGANTWQIGAEVMKDDESLRYMDKPSKDGFSIDTAKRYYDGLDVHYSSGVFNRLFYLLSTTTGWDARKAFDVMVKANMDYWIPNSSFIEAGCGVISATRDLGYSINDMKQALTSVGINYAKIC